MISLYILDMFRSFQDINEEVTSRHLVIGMCFSERFGLWTIHLLQMIIFYLFSAGQQASTSSVPLSLQPVFHTAARTTL